MPAGPSSCTSSSADSSCSSSSKDRNERCEYSRRVIEDVFRKEYGRVFAGLVRHFGDFQVAEDAIQDAFVIALDVWPSKGIPEKPAAWITTVARNGATSKLRHESLARAKNESLRE